MFNQSSRSNKKSMVRICPIQARNEMYPHLAPKLDYIHMSLSLKKKYHCPITMTQLPHRSFPVTLWQWWRSRSVIKLQTIHCFVHHDGRSIPIPKETAGLNLKTVANSRSNKCGCTLRSKVDLLLYSVSVWNFTQAKIPTLLCFLSLSRSRYAVSFSHLK